MMARLKNRKTIMIIHFIPPDRCPDTSFCSREYGDFYQFSPKGPSGLNVLIDLKGVPLQLRSITEEKSSPFSEEVKIACKHAIEGWQQGFPYSGFEIIFEGKEIGILYLENDFSNPSCLRTIIFSQDLLSLGFQFSLFNILQRYLLFLEKLGYEVVHQNVPIVTDQNSSREAIEDVRNLFSNFSFDVDILDGVSATTPINISSPIERMEIISHLDPFSLFCFLKWIPKNQPYGAYLSTTGTIIQMALNSTSSAITPLIKTKKLTIPYSFYENKEKITIDFSRNPKPFGIQIISPSFILESFKETDIAKHSSLLKPIEEETNISPEKKIREDLRIENPYSPFLLSDKDRFPLGMVSLSPFMQIPEYLFVEIAIPSLDKNNLNHQKFDHGVDEFEILEAPIESPFLAQPSKTYVEILEAITVYVESLTQHGAHFTTSDQRQIISQSIIFILPDSCNEKIATEIVNELFPSRMERPSYHSMEGLQSIQWSIEAT